jgi:hypothetical protein
MRKAYLYVAALMLLLGGALHAQAPIKAKISGNITDSIDKKPVGWATIGLYKSADTRKPLQNIFSGKNGHFQFAAIDTGSYIVIMTCSGYTEKTWAVTVEAGHEKYELGDITLAPAPKQLDKVVVTTQVRKPLIEQDDEKMIYNTEADPSSEGLSAIDVLRKTPMVAIDGDDNVTMNGQSNFKVLLNGRETAMFARNLKEALRSFPANLIKRIEVSTNPSAKYDGEGTGGIINIVTKKKIVGYNGNAGVSSTTLGNYGANASMNLKYGKVGFAGYFSMGGNNSTPARTGHRETYSLQPVSFSKRLSGTSNRGDYYYNFGNLEFSWDIDSTHTVSIYSDINGGRGGFGNYQWYKTILAGTGDTIHSNLYNNSRYQYPSLNTGIDFIKKFKGHEEKELTIKVYRENAKDDTYGMSEQYNPGYTRFIINDNHTTNKQLTLQTDMVLPLDKGKKLEFGGKAIVRRAVSDYISLFKYDASSKYETDVRNSDNFNYRQDVYSFYGTYRFKWKEINFKLGGRIERTGINGDFIKTATSVNQEYYTFMPNVYLSRKFKNVHTLSFSYGKRLRRPYIWDLNPFITNIDSLHISQGNPNLGPDIIHTVEMGYTFFRGQTNINIRLSENFSNRQITRYTILDEVTGIFSGIVQNAGVARTTALNMNISTKIKTKLTFNGGTSLRYTFLRNRFKPGQKNQGIGGYWYSTTSYLFTKKWTATANVNYWYPDIQLQGKQQGAIWYGAGTSYKLLNNKLTVSVNGSNFITKSRKLMSKSSDDNFLDINYWENIVRSITISLRWNFGKLSENVSRKRGVVNDDLNGKTN